MNSKDTKVRKWGFLDPYILQALKYNDNYASIGKRMNQEFNLGITDERARKIVSDFARTPAPDSTTFSSSSTTSYTWDINPSPTPSLPQPFIKGDPNNVLIIGDIHEPFSLKGYLEFCRETQEQYNCGKIIFIGDIIDNHYSSYHETDPDGYSAGQELDRAIDKIQQWYSVFPSATIIIGNHDRMVYRKAQTAGVSKQWVKDYKDVLNTPDWEFVEEYEYLDVLYMHGEGGTARSKIKKELQSIVQGHLHTQAYIEYIVGKHYKVFGMQVGCGVDREAYAMAYAKRFPKPIISTGVVLNGRQPILIPMEL